MRICQAAVFYANDRLMGIQTQLGTSGYSLGILIVGVLPCRQHVTCIHATDVGPQTKAYTTAHVMQVTFVHDSVWVYSRSKFTYPLHQSLRSISRHSLSFAADRMQS